MRRIYLRRSDFEVQRNAEIGFFTELSTPWQAMNLLSRLEPAFHRVVDAIYRRRPQPFPGRERLRRCKIIAHRGQHDNRGVPENTLAAFKAARSCGVWGIELDIRWTRDLVPVVTAHLARARVGRLGQLLEAGRARQHRIELAQPQRLDLHHV
ncbi:MAG: glycerophosphodiester phosphodiesterase, partial [Anaerolineae bacterium]